jgi:hypothetical protein
MLAKCTDSSCSALFSHLAEGRLFRLETEPPLGICTTKTTEYFWLCEHCSVGMTLRLAQDGTVTATGLREAIGDGPRVEFASINREKGLLLRGVSFLSSSDFREADENPIKECGMPHDWEQHDDIVAAASSCPVPDCSSLVIDYRPADSVRSGHPEDWEFTCSRCGMEFTVPQDALIFQSVPKQWLSANTHAA